ncbi:O-antigen ligase family protein [Sanguibacter massiliensis]|uniref:O-antigen ligase family protein n=1 Tax=Sanguibacter massiliensis TaxID=1973217 RepID=UPI00101AEABD|nr:O-antigen ligase family protein [Sanguibacter massiliensis]
MVRLRDTPIALLLVMGGLFTVSWDRFLTVHVASYNVKAPVFLFAAAAGVLLLDSLAGSWQPTTRGRSRLGAVDAAVLGIALILLCAVLVSPNLSLSAVQSVTVVLGALVPYVAVRTVVVRYQALDAALTAFIRGGYAASVFGIYQLAAPFVGLPQIVEYTATSGGLPRISSFSYEAGYFGYFLILVIGAIFARDLLRGRRVSVLRVVAIIAVLVLSNTRATLFTIPLVLAMLVLSWPKRIPAPRVGALVTLGVAWMTVGLVVMWDVVVTAFTRVLTVFDPTEVTSNAPRLEVVGYATRIASENWMWGVGPGGFGAALASESGMSFGDSANEVIVNNVWLQAVVDGGVLYLAAQAILVLVVAVKLYRWRNPVARALTAGWLSVLAVSSLITSYFFDLKLWAVLALIVAAAECWSAACRHSPDSGLEDVPSRSVDPTGDIGPAEGVGTGQQLGDGRR